jgi:hypothetical protein
MKVRFVCDSGANIKSERSEILDTVQDLGLDEGEWEGMDDDQKQNMVNQWANDRLEVYWDDQE